MTDRVGARRRRELGHPGRLILAHDLAQHTIDETGPHRIEFDPRLVDSRVHRRMRIDPGAQQLIGTEPKQIQQYRVDAVHVPARRSGDDRIQQATHPTGAVGQLGGESCVTPGDPAFAQQRWKCQVGIGIPLGHRAQGVEGGPAGRIQRSPLRALALRAALALAMRRSPAPALSRAAHSARTDTSGRAPRAQSAAFIGFFPGA